MSIYRHKSVASIGVMYHKSSKLNDHKEMGTQYTVHPHMYDINKSTLGLQLERK